MKPRLLSTALAALICAQSASALDGTWLGATGNWNAAGTWSGGTIADGADFTANFTGVNITAGETITLGADRTIGNIAFTDASTASNNLLITGANILTLDVASGVPQINVTNQTLTINSVIAGLDGLQKTGTGTLTLNGSSVNTFTGGLKVNAGTLALDFANLATPTNLVNSGNALQINSGTLTITGKNVATNTFQTFNGTTLGAGANTINLTKGATATSANLALGALTLTAGSATVINTGTAWTSNAIPAAEKITISAGGNIAIPVSGQVYANAGLFYRSVANTAGSARYVAVDSAGNLRGQVANSANLVATTNTPTAVNQLTSVNVVFAAATNTSSYALVLNASASGRTLTLSNGGTYELNGMVQAQATNGVTINAGTGTSNIIIGSERNLVINMDNSAPLTINAPIANNSGGASAVTVVSTALSGTTPGTVTFGGANTYTGNTTISGGTLKLSGSTGKLGYTSGTSGTYAGAISIASGATFENASSGTQNLNGAITGGGTLTNSGGGGLVLTNAGNSFGALSISNAGSRVFINTNAGALPAAATVNIASGALVFAVPATSANAITVASGGTLTARAATTLSNVTLPGSGSVIFNNDDANTQLLTISNDQTLTGALTVQVGGSRMIGATSSLGAVTLSGKLSGVGGLVVASSGNFANNPTLFGTGVLTLSGANDYTGATTVTTGTLLINGNSSTATGAVAVNGGTLGGTGSTGGSVTVGATATLAPGASIESLGVASVEFLAGSIYAYELNSAALNGDLTYSTGTLDIVSGVGPLGTALTLMELSSGTLAVNDKLTLISYTGGWTSTELFNYLGSTLADDSTFTLGANQWRFNYNDTTGGTNFSGDQAGAVSFVTMTVIPEPRAALLGGLGLLALLRRRRA